MNSSSAAVLRHLLAIFRWPILGFSLIFATTTTVVGVAVRTTDRNGVLDLRWSSEAPKGFLLIVTLIIAAMFVRLYIAHGVTRHDIVTAVAVLFGPLSILFLLGFAALAAATGLIAGGADSPPVPFDTVSNSLRTLGLGLLVFPAWSVSGWLIGIGFVRFGAWRGIAFLAAAVAPAVLAELASAATQPGSSLPGGAWWVLPTLVAFAGGAWAVRPLTGGVEVRKVLSVPA